LSDTFRLAAESVVQTKLFNLVLFVYPQQLTIDKGQPRGRHPKLLGILVDNRLHFRRYRVQIWIGVCCWHRGSLPLGIRI
jgi:hypothetical protein